MDFSRKWILKENKGYLPTPYFVPPHPGFIVSRDLIIALELRFDLKYKICADMKFMLEGLQASSKNILTSDLILTRMRSGGLSSKFLSRRIKEFYLIYRDLGYSTIQAFEFYIKEIYEEICAVCKMKILVTGSEGFVGKELIDALLSLGHDIVGIDRTKSSNPNYTLFQIDLKQEIKIEHSFYDLVIHCAAAKGDWDISDREFYEDNVVATEEPVKLCSKM